MPVYSGDHSFAVTPLSTGLRFAGTVELGGLSAPPNYARAQVLVERGRRMFPGLNETGRSSASTQHANAFFAFGHGHLGLTLAAVTGRTIAALVAARDPGLDMWPYRIDRF
jgi:D-amino-acid dehydrogenase